jgi:hypothetical protein
MIFWDISAGEVIRNRVILEAKRLLVNLGAKHYRHSRAAKLYR